MLELTRTVRFAVNDSPSPGDAPRARARAPGRAGHNTFAGAPTMHGLGRHYEIDVTCRGEADPVTGYFINIREIDHAVRSAAVPIIEEACRRSPTTDPRDVLPGLIGPIEASLREQLKGRLRVSEPIVARVRWRLTPYYSVEMAAPSASSPSPPAPAPPVLMRQSFEFAASHRLHSPGLSDEQNRALFGKCNLPSGHGHNYRVEPCVAIPTGPTPGAIAARFTLADLERITDERVIQRFDHKHLNLDSPEFACGEGGGNPAGLNPSVENIAKVCFDLLAPAIAGTKTGATLRCVTVWETDKTSCTYPG